MTCYFRYLHHVFKNCPDAWREVKKRVAEDEEGFVFKLREALTQ